MQANHFAAGSAFLNINLSRHKSLRTLEVPASCVHGVFGFNELPDIDSRFLKHVLSTIRAPTFFEVVAIYRDCDFRGVTTPDLQIKPPVRRMSQADRAMEASYHCAQFRALREIHKVRDFRLVLCADVWGGEVEYSVRVLEEGVAAAKAEGVFDYFFS